MKYKVAIMSMLTMINNVFAINGSDYKDLQPSFNLEKFFHGKIKAWGIIQDRRGNILSKFDAHMVGSWAGNTGRLEEDFSYYDSGKKQRRVWIIKRIDDTHYQGTADDIEGKATGEVFGNAINWHYEMYVPVKDSSYKLKFDDWMWAMNDGVVVNRSYLKKFGITFAEITIFMQKQHD